MSRTIRLAARRTVTDALQGSPCRAFAHPAAAQTPSTTMTPRLLLIDDDARLAAMVTDYLKPSGFEVETASTLAAGRKALAEKTYDALILDLMLPDGDGLDLCRELRASPRTRHLPLLMLTARGEPLDRIVGLELGADDYVAKPFELRELLARVRSVLRRTRTTRSESAPEKSSSFEFGNFRLDAESQSLFTGDGARIHLTLAEFQLLHAFVRHPNRVLTRDQLLAASARRGWEPFDRSIDVHISHLRRKIEERPDRPQYIRTIRGAGYMFCPTPGREGPDAL